MSFFSIKRINWKCKKIVKCTRTYIRILLLLLLEVIMTTTHFNFYHLLVTTCSEGRAPEKSIRIFFDTLNNESAGLSVPAATVPASACQCLPKFIHSTVDPDLYQTIIII